MTNVHQRLLDVSEARTTSDFLRHLCAFAHDRGYGTCDAIAFVDTGTNPRAHAMVDNLPRHSDWLALDPTMGRRCPVQQHCRYRSDPILWGSRTYAASAVRDIYDAISPLGLASGVCTALQLPGERVLQVSLHSDRDLNYGSGRQIRDAHALQEFAIHALAAARYLLLPAHPYDRLPALAPIEKHMLQLVADGFSVTDVADRLNLSDQQAREALSATVSAMHCMSALDAALLARRAAIIQ